MVTKTATATATATANSRKPQSKKTYHTFSLKDSEKGLTHTVGVHMTTKQAQRFVGHMRQLGATCELINDAQQNEGQQND